MDEEQSATCEPLDPLTPAAVDVSVVGLVLRGCRLPCLPRRALRRLAE